MSKKTVLILLVLLGIVGASLAYMALDAHIAHFVAPESSPSVCNISSKLNCKAAIESKYSVLWNIPTASYGFLFYSGIAFFALLALLLKATSFTLFVSTILTLSAFACLYSLFLLYVSLFELTALCPICLATYVVNFCIFVVAWLGDRSKAVLLRLRQGLINLFLLPVAFVKSFKPSDKYLLKLANSFFGLVGALALCLLTLVLPNMALNNIRAKVDLSEMALPWPKADNKFDLELRLDNSPWGDYYIGKIDAPIKLVEFFDYECSACKNFAVTLRELLTKFPDQYLLVYKNFPLDSSCNSLIEGGHPNSCLAANLARCAGEQGKFHEVNSYLISLPITDQMDNEIIKREMLRAAEIYGLDQSALDSCIASGRQLKVVANDIEQGEALKLQGTPTLWINGRKAPRSLSAEALQKIFDDILSKS